MLRLARLALFLVLFAKVARSDGLVESLSLGGAYSLHLSGLEDFRGSLETRITGYNFDGPVSFDVRLIRIDRHQFFTADPAWGAGIGVRYFYVHPDLEGSSTSGWLVGLGGGVFHYFTGDSRYPIDPFLEFSLGYLLALSDGFAIIFDSSLGVYPYLARSSYTGQYSILERVRPRGTFITSLLFAW